MARKNMNNTVSSFSQEQVNEEIRKKARELYEKRGRKPGRDMENWLEAERLVKSKMCSF